MIKIEKTQTLNIKLGQHLVCLRHCLDLHNNLKRRYNYFPFIDDDAGDQRDEETGPSHPTITGQRDFLL